MKQAALAGAAKYSRSRWGLIEVLLCGESACFQLL
jgi:hypothetical protein